jgi:Rhs element Vgr protein
MSVPTPTILSAGKAMDKSFEFLSIDIIKEINRIPYALLVFLDGDTAQQKFPISNDPFFEPGKEVEIKLRYEENPSEEASVFKGLVVKHTVEAGEHGTLLTVELKDAALKLNQGRKSVVYRKKTDDSIIGELITNSSLKKGKVASTQPAHAEIVQYYCSDWDFMVARAEVNGMVVSVEAGEVSVQEIAVTGQAKHTLKFGDEKIYGFEIEVDVSQQYADIESVGWDMKNQKLTKASKAKTFNLSQGNLKADDIAKKLGATSQTLSSPVALDEKSLQVWADASMAKSRMSMIKGHISILGVGKIQLLDVVALEGIAEKFNGKTLITGIRHRVDMHGWRTDIQLGIAAERFAAQKDVTDIPAAGLLPAVNGLQIGIVSQSEEDPDGEFRVEVILPGLDPNAGTVWARLAAPDAGNARGYFFRPEPTDEVIVGFFNDDPRQAVILGAMYGSKNTLPKGMALSKNNINKGIVTKKGTTIGFVDDDKSSVFIETPNKNKIIFDDDGQMIQLSDEHGNTITMSKDGVEIKSAKDFKIDASGNVEIKGSKVDVK